MIPKRCCRSCNHCELNHFDSFSFCKLRKIKIHTEISSFVSCYHWLKKEPNLPKISNKVIDEQLDFGTVLISNEV